MAIQIGKFATIPTVAEKQIMEISKPIIKTPIQIPTAPKGRGAGETITQKITQPTQGMDWIKAVGSVFPPVKLLDIGRQPVGTLLPPVIETTGTPEAMAQYQAIAPTPTTAPTTTDPFAGALKGIESGLNLASAALPIMLGVMLMTQVKGLFK